MQWQTTHNSLVVSTEELGWWLRDGRTTTSLIVGPFSLASFPASPQPGDTSITGRCIGGLAVSQLADEVKSTATSSSSSLTSWYFDELTDVDTARSAAGRSVLVPLCLVGRIIVVDDGLRRCTRHSALTTGCPRPDDERTSNSSSTDSFIGLPLNTGHRATVD